MDEFNDDDLLEMEIPPMPESMVVKEGGERLVISHIQVENFKSYYGKQIIGPFHKCFTSIIGPNGSGKSNVIDALLFVFGYRASKIRSKKVSVLIHSSAGRDSLQSCTVTVNFCRITDNEDGTFTKVPASDISVARTAYKNNSSKYTLNGHTVQFKEVAELLRSTGIDLIHNRFLILQGEVEQISMMKPKAEKEEEEGMLEYLEDIIGSSRLKPFINKLSARIEKINEQRALQVQRVQHAEKEKLRLDEPAREVLGQMRLENAITLLNNKIFMAKKSKVDDKIADLREVKGGRDKELYEAKEKLLEITNHSKQVSRERQQLQNKLDKCHEAVQAIEKQRAEQEQLIAKTENDRKRLENKRDKLLADVKSEREKMVELESAPGLSEKKIEEYRRQLADADTEIEECSPILMQKLEEVRKLVKAEEKEKAGLEEQLGEITEEENRLNSQFVLAQQKLMNLQSEEDAQRRKFDTLQTELRDTEELVAKKEKDFDSAESRMPDLESTFEGKTARLKYLKGREQNLNDRIRELRRQFEEQKQAEEGYKSTNQVVNRMMEAKRSGEIPGIYGRLGDLGAIDEKYDVAISTNFSQLEFIVVEDVETAQRCIELLKREQLGVSTFIALNKQQQYWPQIRKVPNTPENAPRMIDLIRVNDQNVLPAFYYVLGDTLVADDITAATRIGIPNSGSGRRWKTVTLKGELVDVTGAMTGGGGQQFRSRIGREVRVDTSNEAAEHDEERAQQLAATQQELSNAEAELTTIKRESGTLDPELRRRQEDLKHLKDTARHMKSEIQNSKSKIAELKKQIEIQKRNVLNSTANPEEVQKVRTEIDDFKSKTSKIAEKTDSLRSQLLNVNDRIEEVNSRVAGPYKKRKDRAEEMKKTAETGINKEKASIASSARNLRKVEVKIENLEEDIQNTETQLEKALERNSAAKNRLGDLDELLKQRQDELEEAKEKLNEYIQSIGERNEEEVELQRQVEELQRELKQINAELASHEARQKTFMSKISKLRLYRLKKLTETLSKEIDTLSVPTAEEEDDDDDENDENLDFFAGHLEPTVKRTVPRQPVVDDGLDPFLVECFGEEEAIEREQELMEIDENEDQPMEEGEEEDGFVMANTSRRSAASSNNSHAHHPNKQPSHNTSPLQRQCFMALPKMDGAAIRGFDLDELEKDVDELEAKRGSKRLNLALVVEYMHKLSRYESEFQHLNWITERRDRHRAFHDRLKKQRLHEFMEGFQQIATLLRTTYQMITIQGDVSLELVDSLDPFAEGIAFNVRPPKKSWKQITNLSGGEKTLASLSLVFGLHHYKPTPLYVMDEIDAALDFRNVSIIANYLLERTRNAQFIVISLRNQMYEKADRLIGIFKVKDCTRNVCVDARKSTRNQPNSPRKNIKSELMAAAEVEV